MSAPVPASPGPGNVRVGGIDMGTNSTRLLVADVALAEGTGTGAPAIGLVEVERLLRITRLGEGVDRDGVLIPAAM